MPDTVISEFMDEKAVFEGLAGLDVHYGPGLVDRPDELMRLVAGARALILRHRTRVRRPLLDVASDLRVIGRFGVGLDNIDVDGCDARGIRVLFS